MKKIWPRMFFIFVVLLSTTLSFGGKKKKNKQMIPPAPSLNLASVIGNNTSKPPVTAKVRSYDPEDMIPVAVYQLRKELDSLPEATALQELTQRIKVHNNNKVSNTLQWKQQCNELYRARALLYASTSNYFQSLQDIAVIINGNFFHNHTDQEFLYRLFIEYYEYLRMQSTLRDFYDQGLQKLKEFKDLALVCKMILAEMASDDWLEKELVNLNAQTNQFVFGADFQEILQGGDSFDEVLTKNLIKSGRKAQIRGVMSPLAIFDVFAVDALLGHLGEAVDWSVLKRESAKIITDLLLSKMRFENNINAADVLSERKNIFSFWPKLVIETSVIRSIVEVMYLYSPSASLQQSDVNKILSIVKDNKSLHESVWGDVLKKYYDCACQFSSDCYIYSMYKDSYKQKPREELKVIIEKLEVVIAHDLPPFFVQQIKELLESCKFTYCTTFLNEKGFFEKGISEAQIKEVCHIFQKIVENDSAHAFDAAMSLGICLLSYMSLEKSKPFINQALLLYDRRSKTRDEKVQEKHRFARFLTVVVSSGVYSLLNFYDKSMLDFVNDLHHRLVDVADGAYAPYVVYLHLALSLFKDDVQVCDAFIGLVNLYVKITTKEVYYDQVRYCYKQGLKKIETKINDAQFYTLFFEKALKALIKENACILLELLVKNKKLDHLTVSELSLLIHAYARVGFADDVHTVSMQAALLDKLKQVPIETVACEQLLAAFNCFTLKNPEVAIKKLQCRAHIILKQKPKKVQEYVDCLFIVEKCLYDSAFLLSDSMSEQEAVIAIATQVLNCALEQGLFTSVLSSCMCYDKIADLMADYGKCFLLVYQSEVLDFQDFAKIADFLTYNYCRLPQEKAHALFELLIKSVTFDPFKMEDYFDRVDILAAICVDEEYHCLTHCYVKYAKSLLVSDEVLAHNADVKSFYVKVQALATKLRMSDEYTVLVQKLDTIIADIENYMCVGMYTAVEQRLACLLDVQSYHVRKKAFDKFFKMVKRTSEKLPDSYTFVSAYASLVPSLNAPLSQLQGVQVLIEVCRLFEQYAGEAIGAFTCEYQQHVLDYAVKIVSDLLASKKYSIESIYAQCSSQIALTHVQQALAIIAALPQFSGEMAQYCVDQLWKTKNYELCISDMFVELIKKLRTCNDTQRELKAYILMARHCVASLSKGVIDSNEAIVKSLYEACKKLTGKDQWDAYYLLKSRASDSFMSSTRKELLSAIRFVFENPQAIIEGLYTGEFSIDDISISTLDKLVLLIEKNKVIYGDRLYCLAYYFYISKLLTSQKSFEPQFLVHAHNYLISLREFLTNSDEISAVDRLLERIVSQLS